jgi:glycosyltransferase involved in cell wall biosynthesis
MRRLALVTSHPIQYQAPWFRALTQVTDLEVFFCHRQDAAGQAAAGFGVEFEWDIPLLDGYRSTWLKNVSRQPGVSSFFGCDTPEIAMRLRDGRFDACLVSGWYLKSYMQAIAACKRQGIPVLSRGDSHLGTARSAWWSTAKYLPYRWLLRTIDAHLYVGKANRAYLKHYGVDDSALFFTPHFVDNDFFRSRAVTALESGQTRAIRQQLGIPPSALVFAFAGKLIEMKRAADLIRALAAIRNAGTEPWGMIIGSGPLQTELETLTTELDAPVRFTGFRNQSELPSYFAAADALVLPSDGRETWGLVVNEAMACGLPAIVSGAAGCAVDLIEPGRTGHIFPTGNIDGLASFILNVASALTSNRESVRHNVLQKISNYTCDAAVRGTLDALDAVTDRRTRADARPQTTHSRSSNLSS